MAASARALAAGSPLGALTRIALATAAAALETRGDHANALRAHLIAARRLSGAARCSRPAADA